jgi:ferredoxin-NADP reductase/Na+-translocating ferredoxin:NAD+ oxidoreductase RnfD subunit
MFTLVDKFINRFSMYKLVLYILGTYTGLAVLFGFTGTVQFSGTSLLASAAILLTSCYVANQLFAKLYGAVTNSESAITTALILFCIFLPPRTALDALILAILGVIAMATKYIVAWRARHIFNPAALAAFIVGLLGLAHAGWWVATSVMLPFVAIGGLIMLRKLRRFHLFFSFLVPAVAGILLLNMGDRDLTGASIDAFVSFPVMFLGTIMLTEPLTTPPRKHLRIVYGVLVGLLVGFAPRLHAGGIFMAPELALLLGNIFAYTTVLRKRLPLRLVSRREIGPGIFDLRFTSRYPFHFTPGQYMDVTLPAGALDIQGNRRTFSIASAPSESETGFGVRILQPASGFKTRLLAMQPGDHMYGVQVAGDFVLPKDPSRKLVFIAGGIGITPFRSMLQHVASIGQQRDIVLLYQVTAPDQAVYRDVLARAHEAGLHTIYILAGKPEAVPKGWQGETGFITADMLARKVPDFKERMFYISGPPAMVDNYKALLRRTGIARRRIVTDHFSGY